MAVEMTDAEKLEALLRHAIQKKWVAPMHVPDGFVLVFGVFPGAHLIAFNYKTEYGPDFDPFKPGVGTFTQAKETILFNQDFARALFGEKYIQVDHINDNGEGIYYWRTQGLDDAWFDGPAWVFHLQQAVIAENPIAYMYNAVFGGTG